MHVPPKGVVVLIFTTVLLNGPSEDGEVGRALK